jgi:hypothetical protein
MKSIGHKNVIFVDNVLLQYFTLWYVPDDITLIWLQPRKHTKVYLSEKCSLSSFESIKTETSPQNIM